MTVPTFNGSDNVSIGSSTSIVSSFRGSIGRLGLGRLLYEDVIERAGRSDYPAIACEVNFQPPNPVSDAFHARFGFAEVGRGASDNGTKVVRYLVRRTGG
jgi:predicted GNAT superfamily acetyltransferase